MITAPAAVSSRAPRAAGQTAPPAGTLAAINAPAPPSRPGRPGSDHPAWLARRGWSPARAGEALTTSRKLAGISAGFRAAPLTVGNGIRTCPRSAALASTATALVTRSSFMTFRLLILLVAAVSLAAAACGSHPPSPASHRASAAPVPCRQQYEAWAHGPVRITARKLKADMKAVQAAGKSGDVPGMRSAMEELPPAALALASRPIPHCADPASHYAEFLVRIYTAGHKARSAQGLSGLRRAAAPLKGLKNISHQMTLELHRALGTGTSEL